MSFWNSSHLNKILKTRMTFGKSLSLRPMYSHFNLGYFLGYIRISLMYDGNISPKNSGTSLSSTSILLFLSMQYGKVRLE